MIKISTFSVAADAPSGTLVTILTPVTKRGVMVPSLFRLAEPGLFVVAGDALLTGVWDRRPAPGNYTAHIIATARADGQPMGSRAVVVEIVPALGGRMTITTASGAVVTGAGDDDMLFIPVPPTS